MTSRDAAMLGWHEDTFAAPTLGAQEKRFRSMLGEALATQLIEEFDRARPSTLSMRDVGVGDGRVADPGTYVAVHYRARLVGDGSLIEDDEREQAKAE